MPDVESSDDRILNSIDNESPGPSNNQSNTLNPISQFAKYTSIGHQEIQNAHQNTDLMFQNMNDQERLNIIKAGVTKIQEGFDPSQQQAQPWYMRLEQNVAQMIPQYADVAAQGAVGAAGGAGVGAGVGALVGGLGAIPGAAAGGSWGFTVGSAKAIWEQSAGELYGELRMHDVPHDTAKNVSMAVGSINAGLNFVSLGMIRGVAGKAMTQVERSVILNALSSDMAQQIQKNMFGRFAMDTAVNTTAQTAIGTATAFNNELAKVISGLIEKRDGGAFTTWKQVAETTKQAFFDSLLTGAVVSGLAHAGGQAAGTVKAKALTEIQKRTQIAEVLKGATIENTIAKLHEHLADQPFLFENPEDNNAKVIHDDKGNVYITSGAVNKEPEGLDAIYPEYKPTTQKEIEQHPGHFKKIGAEIERPLNTTEVHARLNQIAYELRILKREDKRLEQHIREREQFGNVSHKEVSNWQRIGEEISKLEADKEFLESGHATIKTEAGKVGQLKLKAITKVFDSIHLKEKQGGRAARLEIRKMQRLLANFINESTQDENIRASAKHLINEITTPEQMQKAVEKIKEHVLKAEARKFELADEADREKTFTNIQNLVKKYKVNQDKGHPVSKLPAETQKKLHVLRGFLKDKKSIEKFEESVALKHGNTPIDKLPEDVKFKMRLADMAINIHNGDALSRNVTAGEIAQWIADGEKIIQAKRVALQKIKKDTLQSAKASIGISPELKYTMTQIEQVRNGLLELKNTIMTWNNLLDSVSLHDKDHRLTKLLDEAPSRHNYLQSRDRSKLNAIQFIQDKVKENILQKVWNDNNTEVTLKYKTLTGAVKTVMTRAQALDAYLKYLDPTLHESLREGNKFTLPGDVEKGKSTIEAIQSILTEDDHEQLQGLLDFYKDYHAYVNNFYKEKYGTDLPMRENYSPVSRQGYEVNAPYSEEGLQYYNLLPSSAKTRKDSKLPIQFTNPMQSLNSHVDQWEYFVHYSDLLDRIGHVLTDNEIRSHIRNNYGHGTLKIMDDFHKRFIMDDPVPSIPGDGWWAAIKGDFSNTMMGFRLNQFFTILPHGLNMWADYAPSEIVKGALQTIKDPIGTEKALRESPVFEERFRHGTTFDLQNALHQTGLFGNTISKLIGVEPTLDDVRINTMIKRFMYGAHIGADVGMQRVFGSAVYHAELGRGATPKQALIAVERAVEQTQPGHSVSQTPHFQANNRLATTMLSQYSQHPSQILGKALNAIGEFKPGEPQAWLKLGHKLGALWVIPGALSASASLAPLVLGQNEKDNKYQKENLWWNFAHGVFGGAILGPSSGVPLIGDVLQSLWFQSAKLLIGTDETSVGGLSHHNFLSEIYDNLKPMLQEWSKLTDAHDNISIPDPFDDHSKEYRKEISKVKLATFATGAPSQLGLGPLATFRSIEKKDPVGSLFAIGGWSPGMISKRYPENITQYAGHIGEKHGILRSYLEGVYSNLQMPKSSEDPANYDAASEFLKEATKK